MFKFNFVSTFFLSVHLLIDETHPLSELPITVASLRNKGLSGAFAAELLSRMAKICGPKVFVQKWSQSNLKFIDFINRDQENIVKIINNYVSLEFIEIFVSTNKNLFIVTYLWLRILKWHMLQIHLSDKL